MNASFTRRRALVTGASTLAALAGGVPPLRGAPAAGKRIGFVDYDLTGYHPRVFLRALRGPLADRGYELAGCHGMLEEKGRPWAEENDVPWFDDIASLEDAVDAFMILAPSNPGRHLELCEKVFPFGKPTYVDKTFAPDVATAEKIFALADEQGAPVQTTSALRYSNVEEAGPDTLRHMTAWVGGSNFSEYVVHPVELIVSCMGPEVVRLLRRGSEPETQLLVDFSDGRTGTVNVFNDTRTKYSASVTTTEATRYLEVDLKEIFERNLAAILDFFESGEPNVPRAETMAVMRILDAAKSPDSRRDWVELG